MSRINVNGADLYYEEHGTGVETIVFAHGCLLSCRQFDGQVAALQGQYRCIAFDFRGQGQSKVTRGGYDMEALARDAAALIEALGAAPCHFVGCSMGGFVGMRLAARGDGLLRSLTLVGSSASPEPRPWRFRLLLWAALCIGMRAVTPWVMPVQFGPRFLGSTERAAERQVWFERMAANDRSGGTRAAAGVIDRVDFGGSLGRIRVPTLIVVGERDRATPLPESQKLLAGIKGAALEIIPGAGHAVSVEDPKAVTDAIARFLGETPRRLGGQTG